MTDDTDDDAAAAQQVAADIKSFGKSRELSNEEFVRQLAVSQAAEKRRLRYEQECRAQHQQELAEAEAKAVADAERQALLERQAAQRRHSAEFAERTRQRDHERSVYNKLMAAERFRNEAVAAARRNAVIQQRQATIADLEADIAAMVPKPQPEQQVIVQQVEPDDDRIWYSPDPNKSWF